MPVLSRVVISNCTTRKAVGHAIGINDVSHSGGALATAGRWKRLVRSAPARLSARELYKGRSISDAATIAAELKARLYVVSAGLGLVAADDLVPNYNLTVTPGSLVAEMLAAQGLEVHSWWTALTQNSPFPLSRLAAGSSVFLALPATYLRLVREDLASVSEEARCNLWIFTSEAGRSEVPQSLASRVMPYDDRLETVPGFAGTRADFPQRALRHFVESIQGHESVGDEGRRLVLASLAGQRRRELPQRTRVSDEEVCELIRARWAACAGSSARLLRYLRDEAKVSCEQGRFRTLWQSLKTEMDGGSDRA